MKNMFKKKRAITTEAEVVREVRPLTDEEHVLLNKRPVDVAHANKTGDVIVTAHGRFIIV